MLSTFDTFVDHIYTCVSTSILMCPECKWVIHIRIFGHWVLFVHLWDSIFSRHDEWTFFGLWTSTGYFGTAISDHSLPTQHMTALLQGNFVPLCWFFASDIGAYLGFRWFITTILLLFRGFWMGLESQQFADARQELLSKGQEVELWGVQSFVNVNFSKSKLLNQ